MSEKMVSLLAACAITAAGLAIAAPAVAQQRTGVVTATIIDDVPVRHVSYRDLNLARAEGASTLLKRVNYAVNDVCWESVGNDMLRRFAARDCRDQSFARAEPQINRAIQRAREMASNGYSAIAPVAITISAQ